IHGYLAMATPLLWSRQPDSVGVLGLALNACGERTGGHEADIDRIRELIATARELWRYVPEIENESERIKAARATFRLIHLADIVAVTSGVGSTEPPESAGGGLAGAGAGSSE
ncbi:MAG TPA: hypothetical protein VLN26_10135, partial [Gaiellaceae bacterium]|nr:hypothetical protein [Gaiellaceae bacterium]